MAVGTPENGVEPAPSPAREQILCPYCGCRQAASEQCEACHGLFDPLSRQATQNQMGPWFVRNERNPFAPGMSYDRLRQMALRGRLKRDSVIRGPSTRQFWALACNTPGIACLLGECHNCHGSVESDEYMCRSCGVVLSWSSDRQHMGLSPVKLLPGEAPAAEVASSGMSGGESRPVQPAPGPRAPSSAEVSMWSERVAGPPAVASARTPGTAASIARSAPTAAGTPGAQPQKARKRKSSSSKRRRKRDIAQRNALIGVIGFSVLVVSASLVAVFGFGVGVGANAPGAAAPAAAPAPLVKDEPSAATNDQAKAPEAPAPQWLSAGAAAALASWAAELDEARADAFTEDAARVRQAITTLENVLMNARSTPAIEPSVLAELEKQIATLRARADALRLKELVDG